MHPELNPFAPGSGLAPPALVGRDREIESFDLTVAKSRRRNHTRGMVLHGLRGVGKTVLLNRFREQAESAGWFIVELEGRDSETGREAIRLKLGRALLQAASRAHRGKAFGDNVRQALGSVKSLSLSLGVVGMEIGVEATPGRADSGRIEIDFEEMLEDLAPGLREDSSAFGLFIDEMQDVDNELLVALLAAQHRAGQQGWPFYIFGAGLPDLPAVLSGARSYAERLFDYRTVGPLNESAARLALTDPLERGGMSVMPVALDLLVKAAGGYPYFLQTFGSAAWNAAPKRTITEGDAMSAIATGNAELDMGFFFSRWSNSSPAERRYVQAMASLPGPQYATSEIATALRTKLTTLSSTRQSLIHKGIIYPPERGQVAFTVPGMPGYISRQFTE